MKSNAAHVRLAYLGPAGSNSERAALALAAPRDCIPLHSIPEVFEAVERGKADAGIVPIENTVEGSVGVTMDLLMRCELRIVGEVKVRIRHSLLAKCKKNEVRKVMSHPQALGQCREYLRKHLAGAELVEMSSTAKAAEFASRNKKAGIAAIAHASLAKKLGLRVIAENVEDARENITRFLVIAKKEGRITAGDSRNAMVKRKSSVTKTSLLLVTRDVPGALASALTPLGENGVNLRRIESRPVPNKPWKYAFFIDLEGSATGKRAAKAIAEMREKAVEVRALGSYPAA